nr:TetR/AcrR family transcriptional regulator [Bacillus licheniformis]
MLVTTNYHKMGVNTFARDERTDHICFALDLMQKYGFKSVTIKDIALHSGVSEMTVYRHFKTKLGLLEVRPFNNFLIYQPFSAYLKTISLGTWRKT